MTKVKKIKKWQYHLSNSVLIFWMIKRNWDFVDYDRGKLIFVKILFKLLNLFYFIDLKIIFGKNMHFARASECLIF